MIDIHATYPLQYINLKNYTCKIYTLYSYTLMRQEYTINDTVNIL